MLSVTHKVPGGKLLRLKTGVDDGKMVAPQLSGDFFLTPPEKITALEEALDGFALDGEDLLELLDYVVEREGITLTGISTSDIVEAVRRLR